MGCYAVKDFPQAQVWCSFGLMILNPSASSTSIWILRCEAESLDSSNSDFTLATARGVGWISGMVG